MRFISMYILYAFHEKNFKNSLHFLNIRIYVAHPIIWSKSLPRFEAFNFVAQGTKKRKKKL